MPRDENTTSLPSTASILAGIHRTHEHQQAEDELRALRDERGALAEERQWLMGNLSGPSVGRTTEKEITELSARLGELEAKITVSRQTLTEHRDAYRERVRSALAPVRRQAATAALGALRDLRAHIETVTEAEAAERPGQPGAAPSWVPRASIDHLKRQLARIAHGGRASLG